MFIQPPSFKHDAGQTLPAIVFPPPPPCLGQQDGVCYSEAISCCDFGVVAMTTLELVCWNVQSARNLNIIGGTRNFFFHLSKKKRKKKLVGRIFWLARFKREPSLKYDFSTTFVCVLKC